MPSPAPRRRDMGYGQQAKAWVIALNIVYGTIAFGLVGFGIGYFFGWNPWALMTGAILGLIVGTYRFIREASALNAPPGGGRAVGQESGRSDGKKTP